MYLRVNVRREVLYLFLNTILCNVLSLSVGATMAYSSVVLPVLRNNTSIILNATELSLFASIINLARIVGSFLCPITMNHGRRYNLIICGVILSLGWILIATSYNVIQLMFGRVLTGLTLGLFSYSINVYLLEISILSWREIITVSSNIGMTWGILIVYFLGYVIKNNWRLIAVFFIVLSIVFVLWSIFFMCESPMWLLLKGRKEAARTALLRIRGLREETIQFQEEFALMVNYNELTNNFEMSENCQLTSTLVKKTTKWSFQNVWNKLNSIQRITLLPEVWKPFVIVNLYLFFHAFTGGNVFVSYTVDIITTVNITIDPFLMTVIIGIIQIIGITVMTCYSTRIGRRTISIVSSAGMSISFVALMVYLEFFNNASIAAIPLACIFLYVWFASLAMLPLPWALIAELYPIKYVNVLGQLTSSLASTWIYIVVQLYPMMVTQDRNATFYFYCIMCIIATFFLIIALPETLGKTKIEIENAFKGKVEIKEETFKKIEDAYLNE